MVGGLVACTRPSLPVPPSLVTALAAPSDAIPADLDVAVRIDLASLKRTLGAAKLGAIRGEVSAKAGDQEGAERQLITDALVTADTAWMAFRPALHAENLDNVVVLRGDFASFDPQKYATSPRFRLPTELGANWRVYERAQPKRRTAVARIYARGANLLVFATTAEIDSVQRVLEAGLRDPHLSPPPRGDFSLEARSSALSSLLRQQVPMAARLLRLSSRLRGYVDLSASGLSSELELVFSDPAQARRGAEALGLWVRALMADGSSDSDALVPLLLKPLVIESLGNSAVVRLTLDQASLGILVACWEAPERCRVKEEAPSGQTQDQEP